MFRQMPYGFCRIELPKSELTRLKSRHAAMLRPAREKYRIR